MSGENNTSNGGSNKSDGVIKSRAVLGDITNRVGKRGLSESSNESDSIAQEKKGNLASSKSGSIEWSKLPNVECSKNFELERCKTLKDDNNANFDAENELLKGCSCSFCLKAAYMWSDLHYQDVKGRISALRKSQKDANALVQKTSKGKDPAVSHSVGSSNKPLKLESDLMNQWRSLFLHVEDVLLSESTKLHSSYHALRDLRENCKMDLESINGVPADRQ